MTDGNVEQAFLSSEDDDMGTSLIHVASGGSVMAKIRALRSVRLLQQTDDSVLRNQCP